MGAPAGMLGRLDNLDILCKDADRMARFYNGVLGLPFFLPYEPGQGWVSIQAGDVTIYVFETREREREPRRTPDNETNRPGFDSFAFAVDDLDATIAVLDEEVEWAGEETRWEHPDGTWYRYRAFYDPEGNMIYVTEPHKVSR
jgi:catechol 2,3-dioxygenase-like lactoylglutathione lyase family enzyme